MIDDRSKHNKPIKHHFLPVFYLQQWAGPDGRLVEFSKPFKNVVKPRRTHPKGTGFVERLYAVEGLPDDLAQEFETEFLSPVDSKAAEALTLMHMGHDYPSPQREAWVSFLISLLFRMPDDIRIFRLAITEIHETFLPALKEAFERNRPSAEQRSFEEVSAEVLAGSPLRVFQHARKLMSHQSAHKILIGMHWSIISLDKAKCSLLTSDRPTIHTDTFGSPDSHLVLPIGPRKLFVAAQQRETIAQIKSVSVDRLASTVNTAVVCAARKYAYGDTDTQLRFVQNRLGATSAPTLMERGLSSMRARYGDFLTGIKQASDEL